MGWQSDLREYGLGAVGGASGATIALAVERNFDGTVAAWAQAIAGALAFWAIVWQTGAPSRLRQEERRGTAFFAEEAVNNSFDALLPFLKWAGGKGEWRAEFRDLTFYFGKHEDDTLMRLLELPLSTWPRLELYSRIRAYQAAVAEAGKYFDATMGFSGLIATDGLQAKALKIADAKSAFDQAVNRV